jgi:hypothetical protein
VADQDYRCNVCIEAVSRGDFMVRCTCKQVFHVSCSSEAEICPKCGSRIGGVAPVEESKCPKCSRALGDGWRWRCACLTTFHLDCAKRLETCMRCERPMDWVDTRRLKLLPLEKVVKMVDEVGCPGCGRPVPRDNDRAECICGAAHHRDCAGRGRACAKCGAPLDIGQVGAVVGG